MLDIVSIETAKAREQVGALYVGACQTWDQKRERITTALLGAKAEVLAEVLASLPAYVRNDDSVRLILADHEERLRREVRARRERGL